MVNKTTDMEMKIISPYRSNYLSSHHTREIARLVNKNHVTLLPHLKSLESKNVLTSKSIGKNKSYSLNLGNIITKNYITLAEIIESNILMGEVFIIKKIANEILNKNIMGTIILFGSYAKKTFREDSDIDMLYLGNIKETQIEEIKGIGKTYGKIINIKKSAIDNFEKGIRRKDPLIIEIIKNHIIIQNSEPFINMLWRYYNEIK